MSGLEIEIVSEVPADLNMEPLQRVLEELKTTQGLKLADGIINVALVDDEQIRQMNRAYAGNDYATDVLSFSYIEDGGEPIEGVVGEMAVSLETAAKQAEMAGTQLAEEVALLILHGVLHISGYDHQTEEERAWLQQVQQQIMTKAGYSYREFKWQNS